MLKQAINMERLESLWLEQRKLQQRSVPVKYSLSTSSHQDSFVLQVLLESLVLPGQVQESNWEETWKTWNYKGNMQICISFAAHFASFPAPPVIVSTRRITHYTSLCKLWRIQVGDLNQKQLHLLGWILHPSQLSQGTDIYCTPNCTVCILLSTGELQ